MSNLDPTTQLSISELVIYILLTPIIVYVLIRHGKPGYLGWGFLIIFCGLRLVSDGIQIANHKHAAADGSASGSGAIINSIGLSGLLYSLCGIIHEIHHHAFNHSRAMSVVVQIAFHLLISTGIVLAALGGANLAKPESSQNRHATDNALRKVGSLMLLLSAILLVVYAYSTYCRLSSVPSASQSRNGVRLLYSAVLALAFTAIRAIYSVVYTFESSPAGNPITGVFAVRFVLIFLVQLLATLFLVLGGIFTRNICIEAGNTLSGPRYLCAATGSKPGHEGPREALTMKQYGVTQAR